MARTTAAFRLGATNLGGGGASNSLLLPGVLNAMAGSAASVTTVIGNVWTVGGWIKPMYGPPAITAGTRRTFIDINSNASGLQIELTSGGPVMAHGISAFMNGSWQAVSPSYIYQSYSWVHLVVSKSGPSAGVNPYGAFTNGVVTAMTKANDNDYVDASAQIFLGARAGGNPFLGAMRDVFCYARVLTQQEVQGIMYTRAFPTDATRRFNYACSEGSGTTISDAFGLGPVLTLQNSAGWTIDSPYMNRGAA